MQYVAVSSAVQVLGQGPGAAAELSRAGEQHGADAACTLGQQVELLCTNLGVADFGSSVPGNYNGPP